MTNIDATATDSIHATLAGSVVDTVNFGDNEPSVVEVTNVTGTAAIYFTVDGTTAAVAANGTIVVPAAVGATKRVSVRGSSLSVSLISTGTPGYSVRGI